MHFDEVETTAFKDWVIPKLEKISDADADVLADYVVALVKTEDPDDAVKENCLESLPDFLHNDTEAFVNEIMDAIKKKSYLSPPVPPPKPLSAEARPFNPPTGPSAVANKPVYIPTGPSQGGNGNWVPQQGQKRGFHERDMNEVRDGRDPHYGRGGGGDRSYKQVRRDGRTGRAGFPGQDNNAGGYPGLPTSMPNAPGLPHAFAAFDPMNPMASFLAMQAMGMPLPPMPPLPFAPPYAQSAPQATPPGPRGRCKDYDTKGFCALGGLCPYDHGAAPIVVPPSEEYDPNQSLLALPAARNSTGYEQNRSSRGDRGRGGAMGRGRGDRTGRSRAPFSHIGPMTDRSNTTIVVEQIPEENFNEQSVRSFFSQHGNIEEVQMQAYKHLAIVKYTDHNSARRAYDSPKVIFDNRFVKVYWYKPEAVPTPPSPSNGHVVAESTPHEAADVDMVDPAEVAKRQEEAQKAFEERMKRLREAEAKKEEVERKLKEADEAKKKLLEKLAAKTRGTGDEQGDSALLDQLSSLHAEAQGIGSNMTAPEGYVRGGYRGRGAFVPRGRGSFPYRGGFRGRGRGRYTGPPYGASRMVNRLDNRPRKVAVAGVEPGTPKDEALRQYLLNGFDFDSIEQHPDHKDVQIVGFKERYVAEEFIATAEIPEVGKVELSWVPNDFSGAKVGQASTTKDPTKAEAVADDDLMGEKESKQEGHTNGEGAGVGETATAVGGDADYDVADDEDRWMAGT